MLELILAICVIIFIFFFPNFLKLIDKLGKGKKFDELLNENIRLKKEISRLSNEIETKEKFDENYYIEKIKKVRKINTNLSIENQKLKLKIETLEKKSHRNSDSKSEYDETELICRACGSKNNVKYFHVYSGGFKKGEIHIDGSIPLCLDCYNSCDTHEQCGKKIKSDKITKIFGKWECDYFCDCDKKESEE